MIFYSLKTAYEKCNRESSETYLCLDRSNSANFQNLFQFISCYLLIAWLKFKIICHPNYAEVLNKEGTWPQFQKAYISCLHGLFIFWFLAYTAHRQVAHSDNRCNEKFQLCPFCSLSNFLGIENESFWRFLHRNIHWTVGSFYLMSCQNKIDKQLKY